MDALIFFLLSHTFLKRIPIFNVKRILIGLTYGIAMGAIGYFFEDYYRIIAMPVALLMIYLMVKLSFSSNLLVYTLVFLFQAVQFPLVLILQFTQLERQFMFLIGQSLILAIVFLAYKFFPLNKVYRFIEEYIELKFLIFFTTFFAFSVVFYWDFEYSWLYILYYGFILTAILIAIYSVGSKIVHLRYKIPLKNHNDYHIDLGLMVKAYKEENHREIERLNRINDDDKFKLQTENFQIGKTTENIITFIENKQKLHNQRVEIQHNIDYDSNHPVAGIEAIIKMLSILLDNAIESGTDKLVLVELTVAASYIQLTVRNEFVPSDPEEISRIFTIDGYTTKKTNQRGYGLTNLHYDVKNLCGKIMVTCDYRNLGKVKYLNITITI